MEHIHELDQCTINQIAAGEVVEKPASVVKELVENAIDSGATSITVEIRGGGIDLIRVTDNGSGIEKDDIRKAFRRYATSKISRIEDLFTIHSLGFRGEALSSIAAVSQVDLITKTSDSLSGIRYTINGGDETGFEEIGAPTGTTIIVRNIFFNTPVRKKFLKKPPTEGSYIADLMEHLALDNPDVSIHFINNKDDKFHTSGNGDLKEIIYRIYGRDIATNLVPISASTDGIKLEGYLGKPSVNRSSRNFEVFFVNRRFIHDKVISKAIEEGYSQFLMQHKFPFAILHIEMEPDMVDVNVHPSKMEVHFNNVPNLYEFIRSSIAETLSTKEMIPDAYIDEPLINKKPAVTNEPLQKEEHKTIAATIQTKTSYPEPFEYKRIERQKVSDEKPVYADGPAKDPILIEDDNRATIWNKVIEGQKDNSESSKEEDIHSNVIKKSKQIIVEKNVQLSIFDDEKMLSKENREKYKVIGQIFKTYWILEFEDKLFIVDQHAAHEKVNYERMLKRYHDGSVDTQLCNPPIIITFTSLEENIFKNYKSYFEKLGFVLDDFGGREYALREIPLDLYGCANPSEMLCEILDELSSSSGEKDPEVITGKIASMACKASVKGNMNMSVAEMQELIDEMLSLDNPYNCPHGRPTIISMIKYEFDKKFKRIV